MMRAQAIDPAGVRAASTMVTMASCVPELSKEKVVCQGIVGCRKRLSTAFDKPLRHASAIYRFLATAG